MYESKIGFAAVGAAAAALVAQAVGRAQEEGCAAVPAEDGCEFTAMTAEASYTAPVTRSAQFDDARSVDVFVGEGVQMTPGGGAKLVAAIRTRYGLAKAHSGGLRLPETFVKSFCGKAVAPEDHTYTLRYAPHCHGYTLAADQVGAGGGIMLLDFEFTHGRHLDLPKSGVSQIACDGPVSIPANSLSRIFEDISRGGYIDKAKLQGGGSVRLPRASVTAHLPKHIAEGAKHHHWNLCYEGDCYSLNATGKEGSHVGRAVSRFLLPEDAVARSVRTVDVFEGEDVRITPGGAPKLVSTIRSRYGLAQAHSGGLKLPEALVKKHCGKSVAPDDYTYTLRYAPTSRRYSLTAEQLGSGRRLTILDFEFSGRTGSRIVDPPATGVRQLPCEGPVRLPAQSLPRVFEEMARSGYVDKAKLQSDDAPVHRSCITTQVPKEFADFSKQYNWRLNYDGHAYTLMAVSKDASYDVAKYGLPEDA